MGTEQGCQKGWLTFYYFCCINTYNTVKTAKAERDTAMADKTRVRLPTGPPQAILKCAEDVPLEGGADERIAASWNGIRPP